MSDTVRLREVTDADLDVFYIHQCDAGACLMAAFTSPDPTDRDAFDAHWRKVRGEPGITARTILCGDVVAGHIASFHRGADREVTYWLGRECWGRGVATRALTAYLAVETARPLHGRVAADNLGSQRVLEKCGFRVVGRERGHAEARGEEIDELVMRLDAQGAP
ncbi:MAG: GNAT family protein [Candidatus Krumholzibacteriia bacterium]